MVKKILSHSRFPKNLHENPDYYAPDFFLFLLVHMICPILRLEIVLARRVGVKPSHLGILCILVC
jgi:hypothetical protein